MSDNEEDHKTLDALYTRIKTAMEGQGVASVLPSTYECKYRLDTDGKVLRCAVGCLITDAAYNEGMEGTAAEALCTLDNRWYARPGDSPAPSLLAEALNESGVPATPAVQGLLSACQWFHDYKFRRGSAWPSSWRGVYDGYLATR